MGRRFTAIWISVPALAFPISTRVVLLHFFVIDVPIILYPTIIREIGFPPPHESGHRLARVRSRGVVVEASMLAVEVVVMELGVELLVAFCGILVGAGMCPFSTICSCYERFPLTFHPCSIVRVHPSTRFTVLGGSG